MKVYIAGKITDAHDENRPAFAAAAADWRAMGHEVVTPHEVNAGAADMSYAACFRRDIDVLLTCDAIAMLPGWHKSPGARAEREVARLCGLVICDVPARAEIPA
jgi:hypothetical protein